MAGSVGQPTMGWFPFAGVFKSGQTIAVAGNTSRTTELGMGEDGNSGQNQPNRAVDLWLDTVNWKFCVVYCAHTDGGIETFTLGTVTLGSVDMYNSAGVTPNNYVEVKTNYVPPSAGIYTLTYNVTIKNGNSSNYYERNQSFAFIATSGTYSTPAGSDTPGYTVEIVPWMGTKGATGGTRSQVSSFLSGGQWYLSNQNDQANWDIWLDIGTFTFAAIGDEFAAYGIETVKLDGVSFGTIDWYVGAGNPVNQYLTISGSVSAAGVKNYQSIAASKNASSSNYQVTMQSRKWIRTGA